MKYSSAIFPKNAVIELTNNCNLKCIHCYLDKRNRYVLDKKVCKNILDELSKLGCFKIVFTGGEIFLYKDILFEILEYAKKLSFEVTIISNFTLMTVEDLNKLKELGLDHLNISLYGNNSHSYYKVCGEHVDFEEIKKKILYATSIGLDVTILSAGLDILYNDLLEIKKWCEKINLPLNIAFVIYDKEYGKQNAKSLEYDKILKLKTENNPNSAVASENNSNKQLKDKNGFCSAGIQNICIAANGDIFPCANWRIKVGSVYDDSLLNIWETSANLKNIRKYSFNDMECSKCKYFNNCSICPGLNYMSNKDPMKPFNKICEYTKLLNTIHN